MKSAANEGKMVKVFTRTSWDKNGHADVFEAYKALADEISKFSVENNQYIKDIHYVEHASTVLASVVFTTDNILKDVCEQMRTQVQHMEDMIDDLETYKDFVDDIWDLLGDDLKDKLNKKLLIKKE